MPEDNKPGPQGTPAVVTRDTQQRASIAQLLLVARLNARNRRDLAVDSLDRAAHVIFVTCKNWFSAGRDRDADADIGAEVNAPEGKPAITSDNNDKTTHAHRDH